jgi:Recombination endonuclease VII
MKPKPHVVEGVMYSSGRAAARALGISNAEFRRRLDKSAAKTRQQKYVRENRDHVRAKRRQYAGMPEPTRPCPATCEVCGSPPGKRTLHLDHDHMTGTFRGWLCSGCNTAIGLLKDDTRIVARLMEYLRGR